MNLVEQIARKIDGEGAYGVAYPSTRPDAEPIPFTTRQKYFQAKYECLAIDILKMLAGTDREAIRRDLIEWEKDGWRKLGVPIDSNEELLDVIDSKYDDFAPAA